MEFDMHWPQWVFIGVWIIRLSVHAHENGELKKPSKYNFASQLMSFVIIGGLLYFGGFFS